MKKSRFIIIGLFLIIFPIFFNGQHAQAYTYKHGKNTTLDKIVAKNLESVYSAMNDKIYIKDIVNGAYQPWSYVINKQKIQSCSPVAMPNTIISSGTLTCEEFLFGKGSDWSGILSKKSSGAINHDTVANYFKKIGYSLEKEKISTQSGEKEEVCIVGTYSSAEETKTIPDKLCGPSGSPIPSSSVHNTGSSAELEIYFSIDGYGCIQLMNSSGFGVLKDRICPSDYKSMDDIKNKLNDINDEANSESTLTYKFSIDNSNDSITYNSYMKKGSKSTVMNKILGETTAKPLSTLEVYNLYIDYISNSKNVKVSCNANYDFSKDSNKWYQVNIKHNGKIDKNCHIQEQRTVQYSLAKKSKKNQYYLTQKNKSLENLADAIKALDLKSILSKAKDINSVDDKSAQDDSQNKNDNKSCYDTGIDSTSWIICPAIDNTSKTVDGIESVIRGMLSIDADQMFKDNDTTYRIWNVFRNIANVTIIIVFLIIIFSQLTGVGIDNYGIKKMLPKLIIMAILINLSYVICQIAVDLSNILGVGLNNLFESVASSAGKTSSTTTDIAGALIKAAAVAAAGGAAASGVISIVGLISGGGVMIIISLILALLVALVAVLMFFIMLGARMIIVVVFTTIAPVAFALYILPNTQNLFKKWWKVFQAALVVFPICGALYGASFIIKAITVGQGKVNFVMAIAAVCAPFLPFLLLPSLLKGALAGLGALGGAITMMGSGLKKGLSRGNDALKGTDRYKAAQERNQERRIQRRAGIDRNGKEIKMGRVGRFMRGGERGIARARAQYAKNLESKNRENDMMGAGFSAVLAGVESKADAQRVADAESLLRNNKVSGVNANDASSVGGYHARLLADYQNAQNEADKAAILTRIKAAQNILSKTDTGRTQVQDNLERAVRGGQTEGLSQAAAHLLGEHGDKYKSANRGAHAMISDLATRSTNDVQAKINGGDYDKAGVNKYTEESIANADEGALQRLVGSMGSMSQAERDTLAETAYKALNNPNIHTQPAVEKQLKALSAGYTPPAAPPQMISHGAYEDPAGNVYHLREMNNGKYLDDSGFEVDITHFKKR